MRKAVAATLSHPRLPSVSYGPLRLMDAVPWLMFASAMRIVAVSGGIITLLALICATIAIFLAFLLSARRMIEISEGTTGLGRLSFHEQLILARTVLRRIVVLMLAACLALAVTGARWPAIAMLSGVDGIAFDQFSAFGMGWSALLAAMMLVMILKAEGGSKATLLEAFKELWLRSVCMVPAIVILTAAYVSLSVVQGAVRPYVYDFWHVPGSPQFMRTMVFVLFVFGFASVRLWITLAILTFALRESYRRGPLPPAPAGQQA